MEPIGQPRYGLGDNLERMTIRSYRQSGLVRAARRIVIKRVGRRSSDVDDLVQNAILDLLKLAAKDRLNLTHPPGFELRWLHRDGAAPGTTTLLADAVRATEFPRDRSVFAWAGVEFQTFRGIRSHWRKVCTLDKSQHLAVAYWRRGKAEGDAPADRH